MRVFLKERGRQGETKRGIKIYRVFGREMRKKRDRKIDI